MEITVYTQKHETNQLINMYNLALNESSVGAAVLVHVARSGRLDAAHR